MEHTTPTKDEIQLLIKNGLLENNEKINKSMDSMADKISQSVTQTTSTFLDKLVEVVKDQATLQADVNTVKDNVKYLWAKMIAVGAACVSVGGLIGYFIDHLNK